MREAFEDLKVLRDIETTVLERIVTYLSNKGEPKEYDVEELKENARRNDFTGANDYYDLWAFDEFHEPNEDTALIGATVEGTTFANNILKVLDGQECRLDS
ncbi:hypothetical protein OIU79_020340, partial [Salix purpurea]